MIDKWERNNERYEVAGFEPEPLEEIGVELLNQMERLNTNLENLVSRQDSVDDTLVHILRRLNEGVTVDCEGDFYKEEKE